MTLSPIKLSRHTALGCHVSSEPWQEICLTLHALKCDRIISNPVGINYVWHNTVATACFCQLQGKRGGQEGREGAFHKRQSPKEPKLSPTSLHPHASCFYCSHVPKLRECKPLFINNTLPILCRCPSLKNSKKTRTKPAEFGFFWPSAGFH